MTGFGDWLIGVVIGGFLLLCCAGLWVAARRGRARRLLRVAYWLLLLYAAELVFVALLLGPSGLWLALGSAGLAGGLALAVSGPRLRRLYEEADARRLMARDCL